MTETQQYLLDYIKFFDEFCREHDIEYFLAGGTLLGAIRHWGFLPWDDDMDLYIKTAEWERAVDIFVNELPERYKVVSRETNPAYLNSIIRIADTETSAFYRSRLADDTAHGVQLELFRLDPISDDPAERDAFYGEHWAYSEAENPYAILNEGRLDYRKLSLKRYQELVQAFENGDTAVTSESYKGLHRWNEEDCSMFHEDWCTYWLLYPKEAFSSRKYVPFEDTMLPAPAGFADVLYGEYGDTWMEIPRAANRAIHDNLENYDISYEDMQEVIDRQIDRKPYLEALRDRKKRLVEKEFHLDAIARQKMKMENGYLSARYSSPEIMNACREAYKSGNWKEILGLTQGLRDKQWEGFSHSYVYDIPDELMYEILHASFMQGEFKYMDRISQYMEGPADSRVRQLFDDLKCLRKLRFSYYYGTMDKYRGEHRDMLSKYPDQIYLNILDIIYRMNEGEDPAKLIAEVRELKDRSGATPRLDKIEADLLMKSGETDEAMLKYTELLNTSNDGMVNNEIREILKD